MKENTKTFTFTKGGKWVGVNVLETRKSNDNATNHSLRKRIAFTLAEVNSLAPLRERVRERGLKHAAFTLAEVLIVLGVVGVVAALTLPTLISNIGSKIKVNRIKNINAKLVQGTDKLMILGQINGYETTEDFVKALSEHYKISSWCKGDKIVECWPYDKIKVDTENGEEFVEIKDLNTPEAFGLKSNKYAEPISFVTADGVPYVIMYNKQCAIDEGDGRANSSACIAGIYDWNGAKTPNKFLTNQSEKENFNTDIQFLGRTSKLGDYGVYLADGLLKPAIGEYKAYKFVGIDYFSEGITCSIEHNNYACEQLTYNRWLTAIDYCKSIGMELPDLDSLLQVYCQTKGRTGNIKILDYFQQSYINFTCNNTEKNDYLSELYNQYQSSKTFWSSTPYIPSHGGKTVDFENNFLRTYPSNGLISYSVICLGK